MKSNQALTVTIAIRDKDGRVIGSKQVVKYEGLLARAHEEGLRSITTDLIQAPSKENAQVAIVKATVTTSKGTFTGIGDANPGNVNARVSGHLLRMAETRGKARALRDAINVDGSVMKMDRDGQNLTTLATGQAPERIAVDLTGNYVYWVNSGLCSTVCNKVMRSDTAGTMVTELASGQNQPLDIAVTTDSVYWTNRGVSTADGSVMRLAK